MNAVLAAWAAVVIQFSVDPQNPRAVAVTAEPVPAKSALTLHRLVGAEGKPGPAIFADTKLEKRRLTVRPRFNLSHGARYVARLKLPDGQVRQMIHRVPEGKGARIPRVTALYPNRSEVPANLLKFYVHFSEPMREGRELFDLIHLVDEDGRRVHSPWRRQELWDKEARRLTMWIHPGRIKRGVNLREAFGPVLRPKTNYRLVIDGRLSSASGQAMGKDHVASFRTGSPDRSLPKPAEWEIDAIKVGHRNPVWIRANEGFDHVLLARHQWIERQNNTRVPGEILVEPGGQSWRFEPTEPWGEGPFMLCVDEWLEDLAGNTPVRPFERDLASPEPLLGVTRVPLAVKR